MARPKSVKRRKNQATKSTCERKKTARHSKLMLSPIEYLKQSNSQLFGDLISNARIKSVSANNYRQSNLNKLNASSINLNAVGYSELIQDLINKRVLNYDDDQEIIDAMLKTDRKYYCPEKNDVCYNDHPTKIPMAQTISAPHMHAHALKELKKNLKPGAHVLDIGSGSGILTVMFANMVNVRGLGEKARGCVIGIDISKEVVDFSLNNISEDTVNRDLLLPQHRDHFKIIESNGKHGFPTKSLKQMYDVIHVGALNDKPYAPKYLKSQLRECGIMFIPTQLNDGRQIIRIYQRINGKIKYIDSDLQVRYVPLVNSV